MRTDTKTIKAILSVITGIMSLLLILFITINHYPTGNDWEITFSKLDENWRDPFQIATFYNPPWIIAMLPHALLPLRLGNAINLILNISLLILVIDKFQGGWKALVLVFTCPFLLDLYRTNNVDWIPMLAVLLPPCAGIPLLVIKPQAIGGIALIWFKRERWRIFLPLIAILLLSLVIWGPWVLEYQGITDVTWNFAPFPFFIPLGIYMLY